MNRGYRTVLSFLGILLLTTITARSQDIPGPGSFKILQDNPIYSGQRQSEVRVTGSGLIGSNVFNADFLLSGINNQVIDDNYSRLNIYSRIGFSGAADIQYTNCEKFLEDSSLIWFAGVSRAAHFGVAMSQDLLKLALRGNKQFAGREIEFGNTAFEYYAYDKISFGLNGFIEDVEWKAGIGLVAGRDHFFADMPTGNLKTSSFGDSITGAIYANWDYMNGDDYYKGYGAAIDLSVSGEFGTNLFAKLSITDLGFVRWNDVQQRKMNDKLYYDGFYYSFDRSERSGLSLMDSLSSKYLSKDSGHVLRALPMSLRIDLNNMIVPNHLVGLFIHFIDLPGYEPLFAVRHHWFMSENFALETSFGYGGFGSLQWQEKIHLQLGDKLGVSAGITGLEGLIVKDLPLNGGGYIQMALFL